MLHGIGSNEEDLRPLVKSFEETHHIFSLRGPMVSTQENMRILQLQHLINLIVMGLINH